MQDLGRQQDAAQKNTFSVEGQDAKRAATAPTQAYADELPGKDEMQAGERVGLQAAASRSQGGRGSQQHSQQTSMQGQQQSSGGRGFFGALAAGIADYLGAKQEQSPQQTGMQQAPAREQAGLVSREAPQQRPQSSLQGMNLDALKDAVGAARDAANAGVKPKGEAKTAAPAQNTPGQEQFQAAKKEQAAAGASRG